MSPIWEEKQRIPKISVTFGSATAMPLRGMTILRLVSEAISMVISSPKHNRCNERSQERYRYIVGEIIRELRNTKIGGKKTKKKKENGREKK